MLGFSLCFLDVPAVIYVFSATVSDRLWAEFVSPQVWAVSHPAIFIAVLCTVTLYLRFSGCFTFLLVCLPACWLAVRFAVPLQVSEEAFDLFILAVPYSLMCLLRGEGGVGRLASLKLFWNKFSRYCILVLSWKGDLKLIVSWTVFTPELLEVEWEVLVSNTIQFLLVSPMHKVAFSALILWILS